MNLAFSVIAMEWFDKISEFDCGSRACDSWFGQGCSFSGYDFLVPTICIGG